MEKFKEFRDRAQLTYANALPLKWKQESGGHLVYREELRYSDYPMALPQGFEEPDTGGFHFNGSGDYVLKPLLECARDLWVSQELYRTSEDKLKLLALAGWKHGYYVKVPQGSKAELRVEADDCSNRLIVRAQEASELDLSVNFSSKSACNRFNASSMQVYAERGSKVTLNYATSSPGSNFLDFEGHVDSGSGMSLSALQVSGEYSRHFGSVDLEEGSSVRLLIGDFVPKRAFGDSMFVVKHGANSTSDVQMRAAVFGKGVIRGITGVKTGAKGSKANLQERVLMVGEEAKAITSPSLDIYEKDVEARHGSWSGRIGSKELFYLESRGLTEEQAIALLIRGMFAPFFVVPMFSDVLGGIINA
ncbi:MAG: SufD family Fe-S cluster assembly protein [Thermoprotei archaeon]